MSLGVNQCSWHFHEIDEPCVKGVLGKFVVVYFDDILIYSKSYDDHPVQLRLCNKFNMIFLNSKEKKQEH